MKGVSRGPRGMRRASAVHPRTHSVWLSAGARFAAQPRAVPIDALGGGACFPGLSSVRVRCGLYYVVKVRVEYNKIEVC